MGQDELPEDRRDDDSDDSLRPTVPPSGRSLPGDSRIGPYRLLTKLGEGGMGEVWLAQQTEPVQRRVALKVIKQGMDTDQVVARFEAERQALALMEHPAIAKVYDAGATPAGRPYFVMEHVQGVPITEYCDRYRLNTRQRLGLFTQVCEGVQHAHHKAVIHRDLTPANVLVTVRDGKPVPKIIDFGVAKATAQKLTERTMHTQVGFMIGTPAYMSPEQAELTGEDVDTRTDVYALGVMLYELLVGALPFDMQEFRQAGIAEMVRTIREYEPPRPSTRLSTLGDQSTQSARCRQTELPVLKRELSGDLDWITLKALEKDRTRRYNSPQELAADIERHLTDQPVLASPPSTAYRARKFIRRHTWGVAAAAVCLLVLIAFAATMALHAKRIAVERDSAERARADLASVVTFQAGMLSDVVPEQMGRWLAEDLRRNLARATREEGLSEAEVSSFLKSYDASMRRVNVTNLALEVVDRNILGRAVETLEVAFGDEPLIDARLRDAIGNTYRTLGRYERAEPQLEAALAIRRRELGADHTDTLASLNGLAIVYRNQGRYDEAEPLLLESVETARRLLGHDDPQTLSSMNHLASLYLNQGRYAESEPLYVETIETMRRVLGGDHPETLIAMNNLAILYWHQRRLAEAERLHLETLETRQRLLGHDHPDTLNSMNNLTLLYAEQGRYGEAEPLHLETLETMRRVLGDDHPHTLNSMNNLAMLYRDQGRYDDAEPLLVETLETRKRVLGPEHPKTLSTMNNLGHLYATLRRFDDAEPLLLAALAAQKRLLGDDHPITAETLYSLACLEALRGNRAAALDRLGQAVTAGLAHVDWVAGDTDLLSVHGPEFDALIAAIRRNAAAQRAR